MALQGFISMESLLSHLKLKISIPMLTSMEKALSA